MDERRLEELVNAAKVGDGEAFGELFREYIKRLHHRVELLIKHYGLDLDLTDEICQDAWLKGLKEIKQVKEPGRFYPWLARIASNMVYHKVEKEKAGNLVQIFSIRCHSHIHLTNGAIPKELREEFGSEGYSLSSDVRVSTKRKDKEWLLTDNSNDRTYTIRKQSGGLRVHLPLNRRLLVRDVGVKLSGSTVALWEEFLANWGNAILSLPTQQCEVYSLRLQERLTNAEIAERTGIDANTVRVQLCKARKRVLLDLSKRYGCSLNEVRSEIAGALASYGEYLEVFLEE